MKKIAIALTLATVFFTFGSIAYASDSSLAKDGLSINPGIGYYNFDTDLLIEDKSFPSLGVEYRFQNNIALEGTYVTTETNAEADASNKFDWTHYHLDALYYLNRNSKLQPYLAAGAGEGTFSYSDGRSSDDDTLLNIGGGIKYFFTPALSLRGDLRAVNSQDYEMTAGSATVSLAWLLGGSLSSDRRGDFDLSQADADKDLIADTDDLCPGTPPSVAVDEKGCALDLDNDGIADYRDQCSDTEASVAVDGVGCPQDLDQDGIADYQDKCLGSKKGHVIDADGCAVKVTEAVSMNLNVNFPTNSSILRKELMTEVQELATFMKRYNNTIAVIEGHSDNKGDPRYNKFLSQKRADEIRRILITQFNISGERLKAIGYGEEIPVADNLTTEGRQQNRRVVAVINTSVEKEQP